MAERHRILIIEDNDELRKQLKWALADSFDVDESSGAKDDVLEKVDAFQPEIITLDINLSGSQHGREGLDLLPDIIGRVPFVKVVVITANDSKELALESIDKGAFDYCVKPISLDELKIIVKRAAKMAELEAELASYRSLETGISFAGMLGASSSMKALSDKIKTISQTDLTVLITGESGAGKELVARAVHQLGVRREKPFVVVNCGAIPEQLIESELFGYEKGAFTGAVSTKKGKFEMANGGTLFLDEIGDLPFALQVKLLRFLEDKLIERVGGTNSIKLDVRVIAATNVNLEQKVADGGFREDLYFRLNVIGINVPPLRERDGDVLLLAESFVERFCRELKVPLKRLSKKAKDILQAHNWPGNVRELQNVIIKGILNSNGQTIEAGDLPLSDEKSANSIGVGALPDSLKDAFSIIEKELVERALKKANGNITLTAKILDISRPKLYELLQKHNIKY